MGRKKKGKKKRRYPWAQWPAERLLALKLCDLGLSLPGTPLERATLRVRRELAERGLKFKPYFWLSDDWFTPAGGTGCAIPFYLAHPRLTRLEYSQLRWVEGGRPGTLLRYLRHEVGHAIHHAFQLSRRRRWTQCFGRSSRPYPVMYRPNPDSRRHVQHLEYWYAQSHPDEDFAETFAVWLGQGRAAWRRRYQGWPARRKLEYVDELMAELAGRTPPVRTRGFVEPVSQIRRTLGEYYAEKKKQHAGDYSQFFDRDLRRLFAGRGQQESAAAFIRRVRPQVVSLVSRWLGDYSYQLKHVLRDIADRVRMLKLRVKGGERQLRLDFALLLTKLTIASLYRNRYWIEM